MNKIIYEDNQLLVVEKPRNVLVQGDDTKDIDLLTSLKLYLLKLVNLREDLVIWLERMNLKRHILLL